MPIVLWWLLGGLAVGGGTGYVLGVESSKLLTLAIIAGAAYFLLKGKLF